MISKFKFGNDQRHDILLGLFRERRDLVESSTEPVVLLPLCSRDVEHTNVLV